MAGNRKKTRPSCGIIDKYDIRKNNTIKCIERGQTNDVRGDLEPRSQVWCY